MTLTETALTLLYVIHCAIWYHLYQFKNVKKTHGGVLLLVKLQAEATPLHGCFLRFLNCTNGTNVSHIQKSTTSF